MIAFSSLASLSLAHVSTLLAATTPSPAEPVQMIGWRPFLTPLPIWDYWFWTLLPLALGIAVVYKTIKTPDTAQIVRESLVLSLWIVLGLIAAAGAIAVVVRLA